MCQLRHYHHIYSHQRRHCWFLHKWHMRHLVKLRVSKKTLDKKLWSETSTMGIGAGKRYQITITTPTSTSPFPTNNPDIIEAGFKLLHCTLTVYNRTFWGKIAFANNFTLAASCSKIVATDENKDPSAEGGPKGKRRPKRKKTENVEETVFNSAILCGASWSVIMVPPVNSQPQSSANPGAQLASEGSIFEKVGMDEQENKGDARSVFEGDAEAVGDDPEDILIRTAEIADEPNTGKDSSRQSLRNCDLPDEKQQELYTATWEVDVYSEYVFDSSKHVDMEVILTASYQLSDGTKLPDNLIESYISSLCHIEEIQIRNTTTLPIHLKSSVLDLSLSHEKWHRSSALRTEMGPRYDQTSSPEMAGDIKRKYLQSDGDEKGKAPFFGHLVVISHGIYGSFLDVLYMKDEIERRYTSAGEKVYVLAVDGNHGVTRDGVDAGGSRIADCILGYVGWDQYGESCESPPSSTNRSAGSNGTVTTSTEIDDSCNKSECPAGLRHIRPIGRVSFIGHSLGGIYNRYAIGLLESVGFFEYFSPTHFITLAAPHLGIADGWRVLNFFLSQGIMGQTGRDLTLQPTERQLSLPLRGESSLERDGGIVSSISPEKSVREMDDLVDVVETSSNEQKHDAQEQEESMASVDRPPLSHAVPPDKISNTASCRFSFLGRFRANNASGDAPISCTSAPTAYAGSTDEDEPQSNENHGLLYATTEPTSTFMLGLAKFKTRTVYSNVINDLAVGYYTGMILHSTFDREAYISQISAINGAAAALNLTILPTQASSRSRVAPMEDGGEHSGGQQSEEASEPDDNRIPYYRCATEKESRGVMEAGLIRTNAPRPIIHDEIVTPESFAARLNFFDPGSSSGDGTSATGTTRNPGTGDSLYSHHRAIKLKLEKCQTMSDRLNSSFPWRKVAVHLDWDAHVNMCVRRRHMNRRGWAVIEHILTEHVFWSDPLE